MTIVLILKRRLFFALVPIQVIKIQTSSLNLHDGTLLNIWKRPNSSTTNWVARLSDVTGRFITSSIIKKI
jgi:hypothetical protein